MNFVFESKKIRRMSNLGKYGIFNNSYININRFLRTRFWEIFLRLKNHESGLKDNTHSKLRKFLSLLL